MYLKKFLTVLSLCLLVPASIFSQEVGDTIIVSSFNYSQTYGINQWSPGIRDTMLDFSVLPQDVTFERVILSYNMRCKNGNVSPPISGQTDIGCGEWDISCNTYLHDSSRVDSVLRQHPEFIVAGFSGDEFPYVSSPTYTVYQYQQQEVEVNSVSNESTHSIGSGSSVLSDVISVQAESGKSQYLITAAELQGAGLSAGLIHGLRLNVLNEGGTADFLRIRMKSTSLSTLAANDIEQDDFTQVYFKNTDLANGNHHFQFATPFNWNGSSNLLLELNFTARATQAPISIEGEDLAEMTALTSTTSDHYAEFGGAQQHIALPAMEVDFSNGLTMSAWVNYDNFNNWSRIIDFGNGANADNVLLANQGTSSNLALSVRIGTSATEFSAPGVLVSGEWMHVAATISPDGTGTIFVNGEAVASDPIQLPANILRSNNYIARSNWNQDGYFDGQLDDVAMWNVALTQSEIQEWMHRDIDATHPQYGNLVFAYNFNDANLSEATDLSANGTNGSLVNYVPSPHYGGRDIFKNMAASDARPNLTFVQGDYDQTVTDLIVLDSIQNPPNVVTRYEVQSNPGTFMNDDIVAVSTTNFWAAWDEIIYDAETGDYIDGFEVEPEAILPLTNLDYFTRWPSKIELLSFVTPYGINLDLGPNGKTWYFDMTDYLPIFQGRKRMTIERGGQWMEDMDIKFLFIVGTPPRNVLDINQIWRVESRPYTLISNNTFFPPREVPLSPEGSTFKIRSAITGHGQQGEFIPRQHFIDLNGGINEFQWQVWKECANNPIYPQGGTWVYDRAGWCPGAPTDVQHFDITPFVSPGGTVNIDYGVLNATGTSNYIVNNQLVTYGPINHSLDARILAVREPSNYVEYERFNSICHSPKVIIQNTGSTPLTSLTISYWINDATTPLTYEWTGNLDFLETERVVLPSMSTLWEATQEDDNVFHVEISAPNGGVDEYGNNDRLDSPFELPAILPNQFIILFRTNFFPHENSYQVIDEDGNVIHSRSGMQSNRLYRDTLLLEAGCYTYRVNDSDDDGLSWWANNDGNGYTRIQAVGGGIIQNFNGDFGDNINFNFSVDVPLSYEELYQDEFELQAYPNPARSFVNIEAPDLQDAHLSLFNSTGQQINVPIDWSGNIARIGTVDLAPGIYIVKVQRDGRISTKRIIVQ